MGRRAGSTDRPGEVRRGKVRRGSEAADIESAHDKRVVGLVVFERCAIDRSGSLLAGPLEARRVTARKRVG